MASRFTAREPGPTSGCMASRFTASRPSSQVGKHAGSGRVSSFSFTFSLWATSHEVLMAVADAALHDIATAIFGVLVASVAFA